jgi:Conjugal transfer protein TraD
MRRAVSDNARKTDTYRKILLGGLVVKAGLQGLDSAVLLGALIDAGVRLQVPGEVERLRGLGDAAFGPRPNSDRSSGVAVGAQGQVVK